VFNLTVGTRTEYSREDKLSSFHDKCLSGMLAWAAVLCLLVYIMHNFLLALI